MEIICNSYVWPQAQSHIKKIGLQDVPEAFTIAFKREINAPDIFPTNIRSFTIEGRDFNGPRFPALPKDAQMRPDLEEKNSMQILVSWKIGFMTHQLTVYFSSENGKYTSCFHRGPKLEGRKEEGGLVSLVQQTAKQAVRKIMAEIEKEN